ncbi:MAG: NADH-quinone oxidoreductase subunit N [Planctomycetaceae bacterium]
MNAIGDLVVRLLDETTKTSVGLFAPELVLSGTIVAMLLCRILPVLWRVPAQWIALLGAFTVFALTLVQFDRLVDVWVNVGAYTKNGVIDSFLSACIRPFSSHIATPFFTGLLMFDQFAAFFRMFLSLFLILTITLTVLSGIPDREDGPDFYTLLLGATLGMMIMASANHLLMVFLGVEMASVPSYALVGFLKGRKKSSEAALKYVVYGAGAAGVMLYGISLLAGLTGTGSLPELANRFSLIVSQGAGIGDPTVRTILLASLMVLVGLAFKLSVFPFHFWCPDVFEGAAAEVAGFLSVASKAGAFALLVRFGLAFSGGSAAVSEIAFALGIGLGVLAAVTATFGNLSAYGQTNIKRMLAYSTIAHAGYMLMAVSALMVMKYSIHGGGAEATDASLSCIEGLIYYLFVYLFMNLGAFAIVALVRNQILSEEIEDYNGLATQCPLLCFGMALCIFSLIGLPPMGGFFAKLVIFASVFKATSAHWAMWFVLGAGAINAVFGLFYYIRILKAMYLKPRPDGARKVSYELMPVGVFVLMLCLPVLGLGILPSRFTETFHRVAEVLLTNR